VTSVSVLEPTTSSLAPEARLYLVPETVKAGPPGERVCEAMMYSEAEFGVMMAVPTVIGTGFFVACAVEPAPACVRISVLEPMTISVAPEAKLYLVPEIDKAGPPGDSVCEPMIYSEAEFGVIMAVPTVIGAGVSIGWAPPVRACVLEPIIIAVAPDARLYRVPEIVKAEPPGDSVCEPTMYSEAEFGVMIAEPTVIGAGVSIR